MPGAPRLTIVPSARTPVRSVMKRIGREMPYPTAFVSFTWRRHPSGEQRVIERGGAREIGNFEDDVVNHSRQANGDATKRNLTVGEWSRAAGRNGEIRSLVCGAGRLLPGSSGSSARR